MEANFDTCDGCKFWSELIAQAIGGGPVQAWCLNPDSPMYHRYAHLGCEKHTPGRAIDDPSPVASEISEDD